MYPLAELRHGFSAEILRFVWDYILHRLRAARGRRTVEWHPRLIEGSTRVPLFFFPTSFSGRQISKCFRLEPSRQLLTPVVKDRPRAESSDRNSLGSTASSGARTPVRLTFPLARNCPKNRACGPCHVGCCVPHPDRGLRSTDHVERAGSGLRARRSSDFDPDGDIPALFKRWFRLRVEEAHQELLWEKACLRRLGSLRQRSARSRLGVLITNPA